MKPGPTPFLESWMKRLLNFHRCDPGALKGVVAPWGGGAADAWRQRKQPAQAGSPAFAAPAPSCFCGKRARSCCSQRPRAPERAAGRGTRADRQSAMATASDFDGRMRRGCVCFLRHPEHTRTHTDTPTCSVMRVHALAHARTHTHTHTHTLHTHNHACARAHTYTHTRSWTRSPNIATRR